nr:immunoglobulin heavy chain junction region [Mus musculus]MBK4189872.1 immunoglobulin heavy chain junction region [Mus musculus]MBK4189874.1 immunoglobulin heavy chain junction region [Mus musculus]MBK4189875.1 immunoglobulin heavy chain junction region [Mus musculus]MBK4189876.1 immunoglobulin heavy chain junction region [Mus musculus]
CARQGSSYPYYAMDYW